MEPPLVGAETLILVRPCRQMRVSWPSALAMTTPAGIRRDGTPVCWGSDLHRQASPPRGERFMAISSGTRYTCGLRHDHSSECWGLVPQVDDESFIGNFGQVWPPHKGVVHRNQQRQLPRLRAAAEWDDPLLGRRCVASTGHATSTAIDSAHYRTCGIREDGTVHCWGPVRPVRPVATGGPLHLR